MQEERIGIPFVGGSGNLLWKTLAAFGLSRRQFRIGNVFWRRPPANNIEVAKRDPLFPQYLAATLQDIKQTKPKAILALGRTAAEALGITRTLKEARGFWWSFDGIPVLPTWHPAAVLRNPKSSLAFKLDLKKFAVGEPPETKPSVLFKPKDIDAFVSFCVRSLEGDDKIACDIETTNKPSWRTTMIGLCDSKEAVNAPPVPAVQVAFQKLFTERGNDLIFHNGSFDMSWLSIEFGLKRGAAAPEDTMLAQHLLLADQPKSLDFCASIWLNVPAWKWIGRTGLDKWGYNLMDCYVTKKLYPILLGELKRAGAEGAYEQKRKEQVTAIAMGLQGLRLDEEEKKRLMIKVLSEQTAVQVSLYESCPPETNLNSPAQLKKLLYKDWKLPAAILKGRVTTNEKALKGLLRKDIPPEKKDWLKKYFQWKHLTSLFSKELKNITTWRDGKVHTVYSVAGAETARWSSNVPLWCKEGGGANLQNRSKPFRSMYLPPKKGWVFLSADYSGAEARIVAWRCNDEVAKDAFLTGKDIHKLTASMMFGVPMDQVTKKLRQIGKRCRHAGNYGITPITLAEILDCPVYQAKDLLERFHRTYPKIRGVFHKKTKELLYKTRTITDAWGVPHFFTGRFDDKLFKEAYASYPQSTCASTLNRALVHFWEWSREKPYVKPALQIHDEIVATCEPQAAPEIFTRLLGFMQFEIPIFDLEQEKIVPLTLPADASIGWNWGVYSDENPKGLRDVASVEEVEKFTR